MEVVPLYSALVSTQQPALYKACNTVDSGQDHMGLEGGAGDGEGPVPVLGASGGRVRRKAIRDDHRTRLHAGEQERPQRRRFGVGDGPEPTPPESRRVEQLDRHSHERFARGATTALARFDAADEGLVDLDLSRQPISTWSHHRRPEAMQHGPRGLVRAEPEEPERWTPSFGQVFVTAKVESGFMIQATLG